VHRRIDPKPPPEAHHDDPEGRHEKHAELSTLDVSERNRDDHQARNGVGRDAVRKENPGQENEGQAAIGDDECRRDEALLVDQTARDEGRREIEEKHEPLDEVLPSPVRVRTPEQDSRK
jgi:hypothetical protein